LNIHFETVHSNSINNFSEFQRPRQTILKKEQDMANVPFQPLEETEIRKPKSKIRWIVLIVIILLVLAATFVLLYLHFTAGKSSNHRSVSKATSKGTLGDCDIDLKRLNVVNIHARTILDMYVPVAFQYLPIRGYVVFWIFRLAACTKISHIRFHKWKNVWGHKLLH
jgi:hypothetical protein